MGPIVDIISVGDLGHGRVPAGSMPSADDGRSGAVVFVSLDHKAYDWEVEAALEWVAASPTVLTVGVTRRVVAPGLDRLADILTTTIGDGAPSSATAVVADLEDALRSVVETVARAPRAAVVLDGLLRVTERSGVQAGLVAETSAYSMLRAGPEFAHWRANNPVRVEDGNDEPAVVVERDGHHLVIELNRPQRHNAFGPEIRDGLVEALDLAQADRTITQIVLRGRGLSFCSGGDLDESDPAAAHLVRIDRSVGARLNRLRARVTVEVHGACVGAGTELPAFAGRVVARPDAFFQLPELSMGLVPGAGGTVSVTRRIGRPRTAYLALTGARIDAATALGWGLVDSLH